MDAGNLRTNLEKSHDLGLNLDTHGCQVIVLYRKDVAASMKSWRILWKSNLSDSDFASSKQDYWLRFLAKWTQPVQVGERRIVLTYCELMGNPVITLGEAIRFLGDKQPDTNRIIQAISAEKNWPLEFSRLHQTA